MTTKLEISYKQALLAKEIKFNGWDLSFEERSSQLTMPESCNTYTLLSIGYVILAKDLFDICYNR